jgi:NADH dehydrogenase (ubiquinone) 1 alpha subcomplex subunit 6
VRHAIRQKFEKNRYVTDRRAIDVLIHKSRQDYQETMNLWKQNDHVLGILLADEEPKAPKTFLQKFYEGE